MKLRNSKTTLLSLALVAAFCGGAVLDANAARRGEQKKEEVLFPDTTRQEPEAKGSPKVLTKLNKLIEAYNKALDQEDEAKATAGYTTARTLADEIIANGSANAYDKALAAQIASQAALNTDDEAAAEDYLKQAVDANALGNNQHFQLMLQLAQLQLQKDDYTNGFATLDKYLAESKSKRPADFAFKGQYLYQADRFAECIPPLKQAIETSTNPEDKVDNWTQILMVCYQEAGQLAEAVKVAEQLAAKSPNDKRAQMNLASIYLNSEQEAKAAAVLEKLRAAGLMTEEKDYRQLYLTYANMDGKEKDVIAVVNEGLQKGIVKPDYQTYLALAQAYYYSEQIPQAIEAWQKAAPLSKDGETYLNLARVLWQEGRVPEAKVAARAALDKGLKKPDDAKKIIALP
ncbi:tetratricopeptide repeat protein [Pseudoxanthomonas mexicana]|uniref:tetratricopeptide repeat protein n=1 Tax=Pseudoxanthomonas mexicana TaxID=128785 RepID=UPI0020A11E1D|nr:tetratricopeptide repeat protein [Pseudoxanthomonas mexicana]MCP1582447.1 tetratricopeptide (TPR) repeat protein [Pseudoxanthomonas mexicana]